MLIINCDRTKETGERLRNYEPKILNDRNILINIGNSKVDEERYRNYEIINRVEAIGRCKNKEEMFKCLKENRVKCLGFGKSRIKAILLLLIGKKLVLRNNGTITITSKIKEIFRKDWVYYTLYEKKALEYRILIYKNKIFRATLKLRLSGDKEILKQENCKFEDVIVGRLREDVKEECIKTSKAIGIDLCGVDVIISTNNRVKIIEVNSGMALCGKSIKRLYCLIKKEIIERGLRENGSLLRCL